MKPSLSQATPDDIPLLVELMAEFYSESGYRLDQGRATRAFAQLLADEHLGRAWLIHTDGQAVGYLVITLVFTMEYGGRSAFLDDLFIRPSFRRSGFGRAALLEVRHILQGEGVRALHVEVGPDNEPAQALYRRLGFADTGRQLLALALAEPTHVV